MVGEGDGWVLSTNYGSSRSVVFMKTLRTYVLVYVLVRGEPESIPIEHIYTFTY